jgi:hypothetical protein
MGLLRRLGIEPTFFRLSQPLWLDLTQVKGSRRQGLMQLNVGPET